MPANSTPNTALPRYCSFPITSRTTSGTSATSRNITARGQFSPWGLSLNTFDRKLITFPCRGGWSASSLALAAVIPVSG